MVTVQEVARVMAVHAAAEAETDINSTAAAAEIDESMAFAPTGTLRRVKKVEDILIITSLPLRPGS